METVKCSAVCERCICVFERVQEELIELLTVRPFVIHNCHTCTAGICTIIRRICNTGICFLTVHQQGNFIRFGGISAAKSVSAEKPDVTIFNKWFKLCRLIYIKIIIFYIFI